MTPDEFVAWARHTDRSRSQWILDDVSLQNRHAYLMYHGGADGTYVEIDGSTVTLGRYEGAVPHIGEAMLTPRFRRKFKTPQEAMVAVATSAGTAALSRKMPRVRAGVQSPREIG